MKNILLLFCLSLTYLGFSQNPNLVSNGNVEQWAFPNSTPDDWSSSSDFGSFNQNTTDFVEGTSSAQFNASFSPLNMFTTVAIPLEANKTYDVKFSYKYLGTTFDSQDNITFSIFSLPTVATVNIQNSNWNTVETEITPTVTDPDYEVMITVEGDGFGGDYIVLIDDIQIVEKETLDIPDDRLKDTIKLITTSDRQILLKNPSDLFISDVSIFSVTGIKQSLKSSGNYSELDLRNLSPGLYIFKISTNRGTLCKKTILH